MKKNLTNKKKNQKGFTLVELIVVIAIIGVLVAMMVPSLIGYVNKAKIQKNNSNARTIASTVQASNAALTKSDVGITLEFVNGAWTPTTGSAELRDDLAKMITVDGSASVTIDGDGKVTKVVYSTSKTEAPSEDVDEASDIFGVWEQAAATPPTTP